jgi:dihydrofolate synthase/folylpolyglutamate synthase
MSYKNRDGIELSLLGTYQTRNAMTVLDTIDVLREGGIEIPEQAIYSGISAARWKARFEILSKSPTVIYDGAHNPEGISVAVESIKSYYPGGRVTVISGVLKDKDYRAVAKSISEVARKVYTITPDSPRALDAEEYAEVFREYGIEAVAIGSVKNAVDIAYSEVLENSSPLFSLGSLYTYKEFTDALLDTKGSIG